MLTGRLRYKEDVFRMLSGEKVFVDTELFQNDLSEIHSKDDALTALIHLGYLGYDNNDKTAYIPNYEVANAFHSAMKTGGWTDVSKLYQSCNDIINSTIRCDAEKVAGYIEIAHETKPLEYSVPWVRFPWLFIISKGTIYGRTAA